MFILICACLPVYYQLTGCLIQHWMYAGKLSTLQQVYPLHLISRLPSMVVGPTECWGLSQSLLQIEIPSDISTWFPNLWTWLFEPINEDMRITWSVNIEGYKTATKLSHSATPFEAHMEDWETKCVASLNKVFTYLLQFNLLMSYLFHKINFIP